MIPYRVFKQGSDGVLHYSGSSEALGEGIREIDCIVDGHQLRVGDVVELDGSWLILQGEDAGEYVYLPAWADSSFTFGDGCWCLQMKARLQHEAAVCEEMTAEAQERAKRREG